MNLQNINEQLQAYTRAQMKYSTTEIFTKKLQKL